MKHRNKILVFFLLFLLFDWSSRGQASVFLDNLIVMTIDSFDKEGDWVAKFSKGRLKNWSNDRKGPYEDSSKWIKWLNSSEYAAEDILPYGVFRNILLKDKEKGILALKAKFEVPGYNWAIIEPSAIRLSKEHVPSRLSMSEAGKDVFKGDSYIEGVHPNFIWMPGKVKSAFVYVWGGNYDYSLEAHFEDNTGRQFIIPVSSLKYKGWRNLRIFTPKVRPSVYPIKFLRFKVNASPYGRPSEFYIYFDYFHALVDTYEESFFGEELQFVEKYWAENKQSTQK